MKTFCWQITNAADHVNPSLELLNETLRKAGGRAAIETGPFGSRLTISIEDEVVPTGRPRIAAKEDLTVAQVQHARFMQVPMAEIANTLGVSVRTLHRRWNAAMQAHIHPDTPYSQWP